MELTGADAGREHALGVGEEVLLRLPENPTTGYRWRLDLPGGVALADSSFTPPARGAGPGAGGTRTFRLRPTSPGVHRVTAALRRSWQPAGDAPADLEFRLRAG